MKVSEIINILADKSFQNIELCRDGILASTGLDCGAYGITIQPEAELLRITLWEAWSGSAISDRLYQDLNQAIAELMLCAAIDLAIESEELSMISER
ncbi:hypothetical protein NIES2135_04890 [Leptolyngbya boryana NIES-2135]|jgi:hypothetical protein|uniref:Uncharacterized protein n=1 Tax=Leptolyngbya boryana NIES-2135 TaxID=1973484 RepID=A0A1Z4JA85_LEPBY|nr:MULTISPECIES: hypothetical protein [Leptolyngbya]BAY53679.1 hypothetical protein NIES2135_04890 [Leptolyngbya boryana NIES-2135]MBD1856588.1 hypothetical protein [Leptolyngbya sp. FACHB-1624]MBD2367882.1 hypothetical protein [Leptolyngbya sp. FACHB-161]MBD2374270.1 hypothetical protein [Leptolyngbya sp. FACHB-238]MBD2398493.1 hypothetical protein [Leptolyngbya sp. FACHB-239]